MTLLELLHLLRQHIKLVIILPVLCALVAAVYCWGFMQNQYTASTSLMVYCKAKADTQLPVTDLAELASDLQLQAEVAQQLGMDSIAGYSVSVENVTSSRVMRISVVGADASTAASVANKMAEAVIDTSKEIEEIRAVSIINEAQVPDNPTGSRRISYIVVALLAGLFAAIALVVLMDMFNTRVRNEREAVELLGVPVIGRFSEVRKGTR